MILLLQVGFDRIELDHNHLRMQISQEGKAL